MPGISQNIQSIAIIGAGIIGCALAFELSKKGYKTLNVDKLPTAGFGSTSNSCALIRAHYSTYEGTAFAYDNFWYWHNWAEYIGVEDERGLAKYHATGTAWLPSKQHGYEHILKLYEQVGVQYEIWDRAKLQERVPILNLNSQWPPRRPESPDFYDESGEKVEFAIYTPGSGSCSDSQRSRNKQSKW